MRGEDLKGTKKQMSVLVASLGVLCVLVFIRDFLRAFAPPREMDPYPLTF
jgi:hypothetical protein